MDIDRIAAAQRLAKMKSVLTPEEDAVMVAVCGKTQSLRAACREVGMGRRKLERILKIALDKLARLDEIDSGSLNAGPVTVQ